MARFRLVHESTVADVDYPLVFGVEVEGNCEVRGNATSGEAIIYYEKVYTLILAAAQPTYQIIIITRCSEYNKSNF